MSPAPDHAPTLGPAARPGHGRSPLRLAATASLTLALTAAPVFAVAQTRPAQGSSGAAAPASSGPSAPPAADAARREQATNYFDAGAEAYKAGKYLAAADAFEKAHALLPSPSLLFSAAQAYRRHYLVQPSAETLRRAVALYRQYLASDPRASRREDAMEALAVLVPHETGANAPPGSTGVAAPGSTGVAPAGSTAVAPPGSTAVAPAGSTAVAPPGSTGVAPPGSTGVAAPVDPRRTARILITASAEGAEVSLDGGPFEPAPLAMNVEPRTHEVRVRAPGHDEARLTIPAVANEQVPQHVRLRPKPGRLEIKGADGAKVAVDGAPIGTAMAFAPLSVEAGSRFVALTLRGHEPFTRRIEVGRDQTVTLDADLATTAQRKVAWTALSAGALGLVGGGVLAGLAVDRQSVALSLQDSAAGAALSVAQRDAFNAAVAARDDLVRASGVTFAASAAMLLVGAGLFVLDMPADVRPPDRPGPADKPSPATTFEVGVGSARLRLVF